MAKNAVTTTRKLRMQFVKSDGETLNVILNNCKSTLKEGSGAAAVKDAMDNVVSLQPFVGTISSYTGAQVIETTTTDVDY